ncbi:MAG: type VI secretion system tip protein VgrG [Chitinispirillales bacterium]|jgi:type VI secretion system secreted protein VgrG|nr:type VI secretion system tip protein VgrG [Chitinispirillales bacterium]
MALIMPKANSAKFLISIADYPLSAFTVTKFSGRDAVSATYSFDIEFQPSESALASGAQAPELTTERVLGKPCRLELIRDKNGEITGYDGVVSEFKRMLKSKPVYAIRLVPWMELLSLNVNNRVFQKLTVIDIVKKVVKDAGLGARCAFKYKCGGAYPKIDFCVQYHESDLNFISRLMEQNGIWYYFTDDGSAIFTDTFAYFPKMADAVPFIENIGFAETEKRLRDGNESETPRQEYLYGDEFGESVYALTSISAVIPKNVRLRNQNYRTPETPPEGASESVCKSDGAWGSVYEYGGAFKNDEEGKRLASLYITRLQTENLRTVGSGRCAAFRAGEIIFINGVGEFLLLSVEHEGGQGGDGRMGGAGSGDREYTYNNHFCCIDSTKKTYAPPLRAKLPVASGIITAPIDALGEDLPNIDEMGRYRVKLPFDLSETPEYGATKDIRLSQISGGDGYGVHFPSKKNSEMILGYVDGNPDKPVGLGLLPDAGARSVSNSENRTENVIRTWGGNELVMDDEKEKSKIAMSTTEGHKLVMDDLKGLAQIAMRTAAGHGLIMNDEDQKEMVTLHTVGGNELIMDDDKDGETVTLSTPKVKGKLGVLSRVKPLLTAASTAMNIAKSISLSKIGLPESGTVVNENIEKSELSLDNKEFSAVLKSCGQEISLKEDVNNSECGINLTTSTMLQMEMNDIERVITIKTPRGNSIELSDLKNNIVVGNAPKVRTVLRKLKEKATDVLDSVKKGEWKILKKESRGKLLKDAKDLLNKAKTNLLETINSIILETDGGKIILTTSGNDGTIEMDNDKDTITLHNAEGKNKIILDGKKKSITLDSPGDINIRAGGNITISGKGKTVVGSKKNIFINTNDETFVGGKKEVKVKGGKIKLN